TRDQTSNDSDSQGGSAEDIVKEEEAKAFNLLARNFRVESSKQKEHAIIAGYKATLLLNVESQRITRLLLEEYRAIAKTARNIKMTQLENEELLKFNKDFAKKFEIFLNENRSLENENSKLSNKINDLEIEVNKLANDKEVIEPCKNCDVLTKEVKSLKCNVSRLQDEALNFLKFKKSVFKCDLLPEDWIEDSGCTIVPMTRNRRLFTWYKESDEWTCHNFGSYLKGKVVGELTKFNSKSYEGVFLGYSQTSKAYIMLNKETIRIEESINVSFDESLPEPKSSFLVEDDRIVELVVQNQVRSPSLEANTSEPVILRI
ncbi:hypothetical protein Tco_1305006, partial [Tanacetum coccineum]